MSNGDDGDGGDDDTLQNCILEVCCGEDGRQERALASAIDKAMPSLSSSDARRVAHWFVDHYDLAPKGSLYAFKQEIARLAQGRPYTDTQVD